MPGLDDFHAFESTKGEGVDGCMKPFLIAAVVIFLLYLLGKCAA